MLAGAATVSRHRDRRLTNARRRLTHRLAWPRARAARGLAPLRRWGRRQRDVPSFVRVAPTPCRRGCSRTDGTMSAAAKFGVPALHRSPRRFAIAAGRSTSVLPSGRSQTARTEPARTDWSRTRARWSETCCAAAGRARSPAGRHSAGRTSPPRSGLRCLTWQRCRSRPPPPAVRWRVLPRRAAPTSRGSRARGD